MEVKTCKDCNQEKSISEFPKNSRGKYKVGHRCKPCSASYAKEYRKKNPLKVLSNKFNFTIPEEVIKHLEIDACEICKRKPPEVKLVTDHCHKRDFVRGRLCDTCNKGLGQFYDNEDYLLEAVLYLRKFKR